MRKMLLVVALMGGAFAAGRALGRRSVTPGPLGGPAGEGPALATFRGGALRLADVQAELRGQPEVLRAQLRTPAGKKAFVEGLVRFELLAREGERKGYQRDPDFVRRYKEELGRVFLEKEFEAPQRKAVPTDDEVRAFHDAHQAALGRPERLRVAVVSFLAPPDDAAARAARRARAEAALARIGRAPADAELFARIARNESEDQASRLTNGELPFLTREQLAERLGAQVAQAVGDLSPGRQLVSGVVETPRGFHVVKLLGREKGYRPSFEESKEAIRARLTSDRRATTLQAFLEQVWKDAGVALDEKAIESLKVD